MYRGSSFLLQKDYKIHTTAVIEIMKPEYDRLLGLTYEDLLDDEVTNLLEELSNQLSTHYNNVRTTVIGHVQTPVSNILITKILLGSLGCTPAYDEYFKKGIRETQVSIGNYNTNSLRRLADFYRTNAERLEKIRKKMQINDAIIYPQMKLLDMGFWQIGKNLNS